MIYHLDMKTEELERRLKRFALDILSLVKKLPYTQENRIYGSQVIRSSSSIGANYAEARYSHSRQDFTHRLNISRKESNETLYWLELILEVNPDFKKDIIDVIDETKQLLKIFISSVKTLKQSNNK